MNANKILVIDDHHLFNEGLTMILESSAHHFEVDTCDDAQDLLAHMDRLSTYDLILIDICLSYRALVF